MDHYHYSHEADGEVWVDGKANNDVKVESFSNSFL